MFSLSPIFSFRPVLFSCFLRSFSSPRFQSSDDCFTHSFDHPHWWPGHMGRSYKELTSLVTRANLIIQLRDSRIPLSSANPQLDSLIGHRRSLLLFNKCDLIPTSARRRLSNSLSIPHLFTSCTQPNSIHDRLVDLLDLIAPQKYKSVPRLLLIVGYPNVGKSSLIANLRRHKLNKSGPKISPIPGETRSVSGFLISDTVFLLDSPGITQPKFDVSTELERERILKLSLCGLIKDDLVGSESIANYALFKMNKEKNFQYIKVLGLDELIGWKWEEIQKFNQNKEQTNEKEEEEESVESNSPAFHGVEDLDLIVESIQRQHLSHGATLPMQRSECLQRFLTYFRDGKFGKICLDFIPKLKKRKNVQKEKL
jgi:ribosome biogenesis GTPase A